MFLIHLRISHKMLMVTLLIAMLILIILIVVIVNTLRVSPVEKPSGRHCDLSLRKQIRGIFMPPSRPPQFPSVTFHFTDGEDLLC